MRLVWARRACVFQGVPGYSHHPAERPAQAPRPRFVPLFFHVNFPSRVDLAINRVQFVTGLSQHISVPASFTSPLRYVLARSFYFSFITQHLNWSDMDRSS